MQQDRPLTVLPTRILHIVQILVSFLYKSCVEPYTGHEILVCLELVLIEAHKVDMSSE